MTSKISDAFPSPSSEELSGKSRAFSAFSSMGTLESSFFLGTSNTISLFESSGSAKIGSIDTALDLIFWLRKRILGVIGRPNEAEYSSIGNFVTSNISLSFWT